MKPPQASRVPTVVDAILAALRGIQGVSLLDGPSPITPQNDAIVIGAQGDASFMVSREKQAGYGISYDETIDVICTIWSASGSSTMKPRRDRCGDLLEQVSSAVDADSTLGGACDLAYMGDAMEWLQQTNNTGAMCSVGFSIRARTNI